MTSDPKPSSSKPQKVPAKKPASPTKTGPKAKAKKQKPRNTEEFRKQRDEEAAMKAQADIDRKEKRKMQAEKKKAEKDEKERRLKDLEAREAKIAAEEAAAKSRIKAMEEEAKGKLAKIETASAKPPAKPPTDATKPDASMPVKCASAAAATAEPRLCTVEEVHGLIGDFQQVLDLAGMLAPKCNITLASASEVLNGCFSRTRVCAQVRNSHINKPLNTDHLSFYTPILRLTRFLINYSAF